MIKPHWVVFTWARDAEHRQNISYDGYRLKLIGLCFHDDRCPDLSDSQTRRVLWPAKTSEMARRWDQLIDYARAHPSHDD